MSTRVQKGGTVFRPVAKSRARQTSTAPDARSSVGPTAATTSNMPQQRAASAMPPPSTIPVKPPSITTEPESHHLTPFLPNTIHDGNAAVISSASVSAVRGGSRPPAVLATPNRLPNHMPSGQRLENIASTVPGPSSGSLPVVPGRSRAAPIVITGPKPTLSLSSTTGPMPSLSSQTPPQQLLTPLSLGSPPRAAPSIDVSQIDPLLLEPRTLPLSQAHAVDQGAASISAFSTGPRIGLNAESSVKAPRSRRRASQRSTEAHDQGSDAEGGSEEDFVLHQQPKGRRTKSSANSTEGAGPSVIAQNGDKPTRKRRTRRSVGEESGSEKDGGSQTTTRKRQRATSTPSRRSRTRGPTPPPFDANAETGEELDPTVVTMAALCADTGQGRVSSKAAQIMNNHAAWRAANREKRARMKMAMEAKKYGRDAEDEQPPAASNEGNAETSQEARAVSSTPSVSSTPVALPSTSGEAERRDEAPTGDGFDYTLDIATSRYNVQVRIGPNGETIIDEESLYVNRNEEGDTENYTHVEESDATKFINSATYSKKVRGSRWSAEETELFYDALSQFGENYELISYVLPGRDRKACKNKFKAEDKKDPARITHCLNDRKPYDIGTLSRLTGKDFSGPTPDIRAPTPLRSTQLDVNAQSQTQIARPAQVPRKQSRTPGLPGDEEVLGDIDDIDPEIMGDDLFGDNVSRDHSILPDRATSSSPVPQV